MFEFFIALFGGIYILYKYIREYFSGVASKEEIEKFNEIKRKQSELMEKLAANRKEIEDAQRHYYDNKVLLSLHEEFKDDLAYIYGEQWENGKWRDAWEEKYGSLCGHYYRLTVLCLAKKGKMQREVIERGICLEQISTDGKEMYESTIRFAKCVEKHLLNAGIKDARLVKTVYGYPSTLTYKIETFCLIGQNGWIRDW